MTKPTTKPKPKTTADIRSRGEIEPPIARRIWWEVAEERTTTGLICHVVDSRGNVFSGYFEMPLRYAKLDLRNRDFPLSINRQFQLNDRIKHLRREDGSTFPLYRITAVGSQLFHETLPPTDREIAEVQSRKRFGSSMVAVGLPATERSKS